MNFRCRMEELVTRALLDLHLHLYSHSYLFAFGIQLYNSNFTGRIKKSSENYTCEYMWDFDGREK